jgi:hypothetical protein
MTEMSTRRDAWIELIAAVVLSTAALGSAWSAYQAARWSGLQTIAFGKANALRAESVRVSNQALQQSQIDVTVFVAWVQSRAQKNTAAAEFIQARFRREFVPAFEAWARTRAAGEVPPGTPFARPEYQLASSRQAEQLGARSDGMFAEALRFNQTSDNFVFAVVLLTSAIFFAGVESKIDSLRIRKVLLTLALLLLGAGLIFMGRLPQTVQF